jgi:hypothetical protein
MMMAGTAWIERRVADRAPIFTALIFANRKLMAAGSAENRRSVEFIERPDLCFVLCGLIVTFAARKPAIATFESYSDNIEQAVVMRAACLIVDHTPVNSDAMNYPHPAVSGRGPSW